jgi:acyl-lipid Delta6-acetylenase / acyl-lipid (9-3)-desaturase
MDAFHSERGRRMYQRLPKSRPETVMLMEASTVPDSTTQIAFRKMRRDLENEGYWKRDLFHEAKLLGIWAGLVVTAAVSSSFIPVVSSFLLGLSMTAAGWLGHDYIHGVDSFTDRFRNFAAFAAGLHPTWWSDKHNKHHALSTFTLRM